MYEYKTNDLNGFVMLVSYQMMLRLQRGPWLKKFIDPCYDLK